MQTVNEILNTGTIEGNVFKLPPQQLDRKTYESVAKALTGIGGKWKGGKIAGFEFNNPTWRADLERLCGGESVNIKKEFEFFTTPKSVTAEMFKRIEIWRPAYLQTSQTKYHLAILEPSAGDGAILRMLKEIPGRNHIFAVELNNRMEGPLNSLGIDGVFCPQDFMEFQGGKFDLIVANPPFSKNQDIKHFMRMFDMLLSDGLLLCVMSAHFTFADDKESVQFREFINENGTYQPLPDGTFKESGTNVRSVLVELIK